MEFIILTIVTCIVLIFIVRFSLKSRSPNPIKKLTNLGILIALAVFSMLMGRYGAIWGFPWWIYYPAPMFLVIIFPLLFFRMKKAEAFKYLIVTIVTGPLIHIAFSLFGWKNYMPFIKIPSLMELLQ